LSTIPAELSFPTDRREASLLVLAFGFLFLAAVALSLAPAARAGDWSLIGSRVGHLLLLPVWAASAWAIHRSARAAVPGRDPYLVPVGLMLAGWGILLIWRLSPVFGARQTAWLAVASGALVAVLRGPANLAWLRRFRYLWLSGAIGLTAATLVLGTNPSGGQERLWLGCCGVYLQPSEPLRLLLIAYLASYLADRLAFAWGTSRQMLPGLVAPILVVWGAAFALLLVQRDLGTGTLMIGLLAVLLYLVTGRRSIPLAAALTALLASVVGYFYIDVVRVRVDAWINPWADPIGGSYQIVQGLIAIASGGVFGRGPGVGSPGFVPVAHTDFIFASVVEEWGLLGALFLIGLLAIVVARGLRASLRSRDSFGTILAAGLSVSLGIQAILILGGVLRVLPLTGVTLPFVSYGGSSLLTTFVSLGLLIVLSGRPGNAEYFRRPVLAINVWFAVAWAVLAAAVGWWVIVRGPVLTARTDNPRRSQAELVSKRGSIFSQEGALLAESTGERGAYLRSYPLPAAVAVTGYDSPRYGLTGIERSMDPTLRGDQGNDPWAVWWSHLLTGVPPPGLDVRLTLDSRIQAEAMLLLDGYRGAAVVLDPLSGDILALASTPSFDPGKLDAQWSSLIARSDSPLLSRGTQAGYQPGTALAPFVLGWAMAHNNVGLDSPLTDIAQPLVVDGRSVACLSPVPVGGPQDYGQAMRSGCARPFADLGLRLDPGSLDRMLSAFGLQSPPLDELPTGGGNASVPALTGEQLRLEAAGQGGLTASPLQVGRAFAALVSSGSLPQLRIIDATRSPGGGWHSVLPLAGPNQVLPPIDADRVLGALMSPGSRVAALSAQAVVGAQDPPLAWFLGADLDSSPMRVVIVVLENGPVPLAASIGRHLFAPAASTLP
jgi:cell division protein FtsW (lipid II flippase)